jgi:hypothetical protein
MPYASHKKILEYHKEYSQRPSVIQARKERYQRLKRRIRKQAKISYNKNKDNTNARRRKNYLVNREKIIRQVTSYYLKNKDKVHKRQRKWYLKNKDRVSQLVRENSRKWYQKNKERTKKNVEAYAKSHPGFRSMVHHNYINRRKRLGGSFKVEEWNEIQKRQNYLCNMCGENKKLTIDHIVPSKKWLSWRRKNKVDYKYNSAKNLQGLCHSCNSSKSDKLNL